MAIKSVQIVAWALKPYPPLIPVPLRDTPKARDEYMEYAVQATKQGTKFSDFYQWAVQEGLNKDHRFFGQLIRAFKEARYDKQATQI